MEDKPKLPDKFHTPHYGIAYYSPKSRKKYHCLCFPSIVFLEIENLIYDSKKCPKAILDDIETKFAENDNTKELSFFLISGIPKGHEMAQGLYYGRIKMFNISRRDTIYPIFDPYYIYIPAPDCSSYEKTVEALKEIIFRFSTLNNNQFIKNFFLLLFSRECTYFPLIGEIHSLHPSKNFCCTISSLILTTAAVSYIDSQKIIFDSIKEFHFYKALVVDPHGTKPNLTNAELASLMEQDYIFCDILHDFEISSDKLKEVFDNIETTLSGLKGEEK